LRAGISPPRRPASLASRRSPPSFDAAQLVLGSENRLKLLTGPFPAPKGSNPDRVVDPSVALVVSDDIALDPPEVIEAVAGKSLVGGGNYRDPNLSDHLPVQMTIDVEGVESCRV
jgi:hypothetical protein